MSNLVVIDLDGPILDGRHRHYACYQRILTEAGYAPLTLGAYWSLKTAPMPLRSVLEHSAAAGFEAEFARLWRERIEDRELLALDVLQAGALARLHDIASTARLVVATMRRDAALAREQIDEMAVGQFVDAVLVTPHADGPNGKAQSVLTYARRQGLSPRLWIGDTEFDADAAAILGVPCVLVANGLRSRDHLRGLRPAAVVDSIADVPAHYFAP